MNDITQRLRASIAHDVVNGTREERQIFVHQIQDAIAWMERQSTEYNDFQKHRCPRCDLVIWAENTTYTDGSPAPCPECSNVRWAMVAEQSLDLNYGPFHLVRFTEGTSHRWIVYRKGMFVFGTVDELKYFMSAAQCLDAIDELLAQERVQKENQ